MLSTFARYGNGVASLGRVTLHIQCALHGAVGISIMTVLINRNIFESKPYGLGEVSSAVEPSSFRFQGRTYASLGAMMEKVLSQPIS